MRWLRVKRPPFQDPLDSGEVLARSGVNHLDRMRWVTTGDKSSALGNGRRYSPIVIVGQTSLLAAWTARLVSPNGSDHPP